MSRCKHRGGVFQREMLGVELCFPKIHMVKFQLPGPQNVTLFGNRVSADVIS